MPATKYTPPTAIAQRRALAQQLGQQGGAMKTPGKWGELLDVLKSYGAYRGGVAAEKQEKANQAIEAKELAAAIAGKSGIGGTPETAITLPGNYDDGGYAALHPGAPNQGEPGLTVFAGGQEPSPFQTPVAQGIHAQNARDLMAEDRAYDLERYKASMKANEPYTLPPLSRRYRGGELVAENTNQYSGGGGVGTQARVRQMDTVEHGIVLLYPDGTVTDMSGNQITSRLTPRATDPSLQGDISAARTEGRLGAERAFTMEGGLEQIAMARQLLSGVDAQGNAVPGWNEPTSGGLDTLGDKFARFFDMTTEGMTGATALEAVGGWLTSRVPRMEGPQSEGDREMYRTMAAKVGDSGYTIKERMAALDVVENIIQKYAGLNQGTGSISPDREAELKAKYGG